MTFLTRFAPSPTGPLHLGHAYSALLAHDMARANGGRFFLRIEDIDQGRSKPAWEKQIYDDLDWLGIHWDGPTLRQSDNLSLYSQALDKLWKTDFLYPCTCTRRDIAEAASAPQEGAPMFGPDGMIYPNTCPMQYKRLPPSFSERPTGLTLRFCLPAFSHLAVKDISGDRFYFQETGLGPNGETGLISIPAEHLETNIGDIVLARKDMGTSYHLSVVLDDAMQGITHVVRGQDLFEATAIHVVLQRVLGLPTPAYHHHKLIRDDHGKRLAKRDDARAISRYRAEGATPDDIRAMVGLE